MNNFIKSVIAVGVSLATAGVVYAGTLSLKIETPKSQTNNTNLSINFVALDYAANGNITAKCFKKGPTDGGFSQFGSDIAITPGGNTGNCTTDSSIMNQQGTYQFYVTAANAAETVTSDTVSVDFNTSAPGTPTQYSKERVNTCDYKIHFRTADDNGETVRIEVYRSANTSFVADSGARVDSINIGSGTEGTSTTTPPNCNQEYYFAVRAFDAAGNASGLVGDSITVTTNTTVTKTTGATGAVGAIPNGTNGNVLGAAIGATGGATGTSGATLGAESSPAPAEAGSARGNLTVRNLGLGVLGIAAILFLAWLLTRKK